MTLIAVTGSTGRVGGRVARLLADSGAEQRLVVRDPARAPRLEGAEVVVASYVDTDAVRRALDGVDVALMVSGAEAEDRLEQHRAFIEGARQAGVGHVVYTSFLGAAPDSVFTLARDHWATEQILAGSGMAWTCLRDNFYADVMPGYVGADGALRGPAGDGRVSLLAAADVADVAVAVLRDPSPHRDTSYPLTGPEALSFSEIAAVIAEVTGHPTTYVAETVEQAYASRAVYDAPPWQVDSWVSTYTAIASGGLAEVSPWVHDLTGHAPRDLRTVLRAR
jgi:uncharacterized protein YbjT (DUF2867 family)